MAPFVPDRDILSYCVDESLDAQEPAGATHSKATG